MLHHWTHLQVTPFPDFPDLETGTLPPNLSLCALRDTYVYAFMGYGLRMGAYGCDMGVNVRRWGKGAVKPAPRV